MCAERVPRLVVGTCLVLTDGCEDNRTDLAVNGVAP